MCFISNAVCLGIQEATLQAAFVFVEKNLREVNVLVFMSGKETPVHASPRVL